MMEVERIERVNPQNGAIENNENQKSKKKRRAPESWKANQRKKAKAEGKEFVSQTGKVISAQPQRREDCKCDCYNKLPPGVFENEFRVFRGLGNSTTQNAYLQGRMEILRKYQDKRGKERKDFVYLVKMESGTEQICQKFWLGMYGIQQSRLRKKVKVFGGNLKDGRGNHNNHYKISDEYVERVRTFIQNLPARPSHYSQSQNINSKYLDSHFTIPCIYQQFRDENPDIEENDIKESYFRFIFNTQYNIRIGLPRTDMCNLCERLFKKLELIRAQRDLNEQDLNLAMQDLENHHKLADGFQKEIHDIRFSGIGWPIALDYKQNMPIPVTRTQDEFFMSQLWIDVFGIVNVRNGEACLFPYSESFSTKGCNETISCLDWSKQNQFVFAYLQHIANTRFEKVRVVFPLPGHSRMPIDGVFGIIECLQRRVEKVSTPSDVVSIIKNAQRSKPFQVVFVEHPLTDDLCDDGTPVVQVKDFKKSLPPVLQSVPGITTIREVIFKVGTTPLCNTSERFGGDEHVHRILKSTTTALDLQNAIVEAPNANHYYKPISSSKFDCVKHLLEAVPLHENCIFFEILYAEEKVAEEEVAPEVVNTPQGKTVKKGKGSTQKSKGKNSTKKSKGQKSTKKPKGNNKENETVAGSSSQNKKSPPKPSSTPYKLYLDNYLHENPSANAFATRAVTCAEIWKNMSENEREIWKQKSKEDKERFEIELKAHRKSKREAKAKAKAS